MEAKQLFKPKVQIVSFHKVSDPDDYMFDHEDSHYLFTVWADGLFSPKDFDGVNLVEVSKLRKLVEYLKDEIWRTFEDKDNPAFITKIKCKEIIDSIFSDLCPTGNLIMINQNSKSKILNSRGKPSVSSPSPNGSIES